MTHPWQTKLEYHQEIVDDNFKYLDEILTLHLNEKIREEQWTE